MFRLALAGIRNLIDEGCSVSLTTVIHRFNYNDLEHIITLAQELGVKQVRLNKLWCTGASPLRYQQLLLRATERRSAMDLIHKLTTKYRSFNSGPLVNQLRITRHSDPTINAKLALTLKLARSQPAQAGAERGLAPARPSGAREMWEPRQRRCLKSS